MNNKELEILEESIRAYLAQDEMEYFEGCQLYASHPSARRGVVINLEQRHEKPTMHEKLIYELEKLVKVEKLTFRSAVPQKPPVKLPVNLAINTQSEAPKNYEYKIPYEKLPEELKKLVVEKGQMYNTMDKSKKELAEIGEVNDDKSVARRKVILEVMHQCSDRVKKIHAILMNFEETLEFNQDEIEILKEKSVGGNQGNKVGHDRMDLSEEEVLDKEFEFKKVSYWQRKDLLKKLRSSVPRQEKRAEESKKEEVVKKNKEKASLGRKMIAVLEKYFEGTQEPKKE